MDDLADMFLCYWIHACAGMTEEEEKRILRKCKRLWWSV
jgi:hypothetical protein